MSMPEMPGMPGAGGAPAALMLMNLQSVNVDTTTHNMNPIDIGEQSHAWAEQTSRMDYGKLNSGGGRPDADWESNNSAFS